MFCFKVIPAVLFIFLLLLLSTDYYLTNVNVFYLKVQKVFKVSYLLCLKCSFSISILFLMFLGTLADACYKVTVHLLVITNVKIWYIK